jgi:hypothetical protein
MYCFCWNVKIEDICILDCLLRFKMLCASAMISL